MCEDIVTKYLVRKDMKQQKSDGVVKEKDHVTLQVNNILT